MGRCSLRLEVFRYGFLVCTFFVALCLSPGGATIEFYSYWHPVCFIQMMNHVCQI
jgi:hypothetical protein